MRYFLNCDGRDFEIEVLSADGDRCRLRLADGRECEASFRAVDGSQHALLVDGRAYAVSIEPEAGADQDLRVAIAGESFRVSAEDERERAASALAGPAGARPEIVKAAMPGVLVAVPVAVGDRIEAGQPVAVLEAMKMQNEVVSEHGGVVAEVLGVAGDTVDAGQALVRLEPPEQD
jgi:biotin carboxyl carrier protein